MSCSDSDTPDKGETTDASKMGEVLTKAEPEPEAEGEEMSSEIPEIASEREDADGAPSSDEQGPLNSDSQMNSDEDSEYDEAFEQDEHQEGPCMCDACIMDRKRTYDSLEEMRRLQAYWMDIRQHIRTVYRQAMDKAAATEAHQPYTKEYMQKLCASDPHQLYQRLESQAQEFVIETKVRQLELLKREKDSPELPSLFISGLLEGHRRLMAAVSELAPLVETLETQHLSKFGLTWRLLNQHLYQSCVYTDPCVTDKVPECIAKLSSSTSESAEANKNLVREFLSFDDEITLVGSMWREVENKIHQYNQEQAAIKAKQLMLKEDWELFKAHRKFIKQKLRESKHNSCEVRAVEETTDIGSDPKGCPCEECTIRHLLSCGLITPPRSPTLSPTSEHGGRTEGEGREQSDSSVAECECHVCTAPPITTPLMDLETAGGSNPNLHGGGFHLYPHIHGTGRVPAVGDNVYPHLLNIHNKLLAANGSLPQPAERKPPKLSAPGGELKGAPVPRPNTPPRPEVPPPAEPVLRPSTPPVPPPKRPEVPPPAKPAGQLKHHRHTTTQTPAPRLHQNLPDVVPPTCHGHNHADGHTHNHGHNHGGKRVPCAGDRKPACHGHDHDEETSPEDSCSDRSSSTQRGENRHCDCCYCEVFGHGVPSVAPVSRNYTEMRERLRQLLTKKKAKCKTGPGVTNGTAAPVTTAPSAAQDKAKPGNVPVVNGDDKKARDPRDLEDLLDFIEGNPLQKCKDEKKAAKKARQKQKKQEELERIKREEEEAERRRIEEEEAARALLKQQRKEAKKLKKKKKALAALGEQAVVDQVPQMVTIKRVMEPHSSEPTVTITLRGQTPREDKVLYTLLNGQVCPLPKDSKTNTKTKQPVQQQQQQQQQNNKAKAKNTQNSGNNSSAKVVNSAPEKTNKVSVAKAKKEPSNSNSSNNGASGKQKTAVVPPPTSNKSNKNQQKSQAPAANNNGNNTSRKTATTQPANQRTAAVPTNNSNNHQKPAPMPTPQQRPVAAVVSAQKKKPEPAPQPPPVAAPALAPKLTSPTAIQINNAINRLSSRQPLPTNFTIDSLNLPPGITITKVDPSQVSTRRPLPQPKPNPPPAMPPPPPQMPMQMQMQQASPNVIVVDTGKLKDLNSVPNKDFSDEANGKKKKKKKNGNGGSVNGSNPVVGEPLKNNMVRLTMNGGPPKRMMAPPQPQNGRMINPNPQAAIIKVNGSMVTIRSPALQQALSASQQQDDNLAGKKKKKKKGGNGQGQQDESSWNHIDEESVFAPKDIDLESGEMDDAERELEAFKRFCLQSVPPKRKEKVHLNIKDIVLKKKSSAISCS